jgi:hypothetical protein
MGGNQVMGLNSSVTVSKEGRAMPVFYAGQGNVSIKNDT